MMDDQDLEARLKTYRPAGPPPELRQRVTDAGSVVANAGRVARRLQPSGRAGLAWLPAVAAMLLAAALYWLAAAGRERVFAQLPAPVAGQAVDLSLEPQP
jgi:hypothetical protein